MIQFRDVERVLIDSRLIAVSDTCRGDITTGSATATATASVDAHTARLLLADTEMRGLAADLNRLAHKLTLITTS
jgi:hypothetical protein